MFNATIKDKTDESQPISQTLLEEVISKKRPSVSGRDLREYERVRSGFTSKPVPWSSDINAEQFEKMKRLDAVIDRINKVNATETIVLGSQQYTQKDGKGKAQVFVNAIKHDFKSKNPTTRWSDIIILK